VNAPSDIKIVVKEHPATYGTRGRAFFQPLKDLPNVVLCDPTVDSYALLSRAQAIVATTGSVGLEGILLGKRVGVLGRPFYVAYKGVKALDYPEEIFEAMADPSWKPDEMRAETRDFLAAYVQSSHRFGHGGGTEIHPASGGDKWAHALLATMDYIEQHGLKPSDFDVTLF
jgi:capsule polysaccharide export protein KpsC/LpsZ